MLRLNSGFGPPYSQQATPVVKDGIMYLPTGQQDVFAIDAKTGNIIWKYQSDADPKTPDNKAKRGIALGEGMVFSSTADIRKPPPSLPPASGGSSGAAEAPPAGRAPRPEPVTYLIALNQKTGKLLWKEELGEDVPKNFRKYITAPPLYYKGLVYMSISGGDSGLRGRLTAHDAKTGKEVWRWYATPGPGEFGNDTWEGDSWKTGGGAMWVQPALDADLGLLYVVTGNPWPDYNGSTRGGDNLFTSSVVALEAATGKYRWHYQTVHHDMWDFDMPTPVILFDQTYGGETRKALAAHSKQGWVYILDRVTGKPLIAVEEKPVPQEPRQKTAATQPVPAGDPTAPQCAEPIKGYEVAACSRRLGTTRRLRARQRRAIGRQALTIRVPGICFSARRSRCAAYSSHGRALVLGGAGRWSDYRARFQNQQASVAERGSLSRRIRQRAPGYRGRFAVPRWHRWIFPRLRFPNRRGTLALPDWLRRGRTRGHL